MIGIGRAGGVLSLCMTAGFLTIGSSPAGAEPIKLTVLTGPTIQQTENRPCVIGDPSCHNPDFLPYTLIAPQNEEGTLTSPEYTVGQIRNVVGGDEFVVGLDLNQARGQEGGTYTLESFSLSVDGTTRFSTSEPVALVPLNFGNGFSDATIVMFNLNGLSDAQKIVFTASFSGGTAGREQFFLSPQVSPDPNNNPVPEPATMLLVGSGLAGLAAVRRRRANAKANAKI
jgi:PEP-CTERM motif